MKRSTCKEVKQAIRQYILDHITLDNYGIDESSLSNSEKILKVFQIFQHEKQWTIFYWGKSHAFQDWLRGVPSAIATVISYYDKRKIIEKWLEETPEESERYSDDTMCDLYYWLLTREFMAMVREGGKTT